MASKFNNIRQEKDFDAEPVQKSRFTLRNKEKRLNYLEANSDNPDQVPTIYTTRRTITTFGARRNHHSIGEKKENYSIL